MSLTTKRFLRRLGYSLILLVISACSCVAWLPGIASKVALQYSISELKAAQVRWNSRHLVNYQMRGDFSWSSLELIIGFTVQNNRVVKTESLNLRSVPPESPTYFDQFMPASLEGYKVDQLFDFVIQKIQRESDTLDLSNSSSVKDVTYHYTIDAQKGFISSLSFTSYKDCTDSFWGLFPTCFIDKSGFVGFTDLEPLNEGVAPQVAF